MTSYFRLVLLACLVLAAATGREIAPASAAYSTVRSPKFHSLSQACQGVLEKECPPHEKSRVDCMLNHFTENDSHECKVWLGARAICFLVATGKLIPEGKCDFGADEATPERIRHCLRNVDKAELPSACTATPYYTSLTLHSPRRLDSDEEAEL